MVAPRYGPGLQQAPLVCRFCSQPRSPPPRPPTDFHQVLKVAILAEKYAVDYTWYVDTILNLIRIAGDYVSEEVWYRVIQIVINRDDVQGYAAKTVFEVSLKMRVQRLKEFYICPVVLHQPSLSHGTFCMLGLS